MVKHTPSQLTLRILFIFLLIFNINIYAVEEETSCHKHTTQSSTIWSAINNPYVVMIIGGIVLPKIILPACDYIADGFSNLYIAYWLTPEQREQLQKEQEEKNANLTMKYQNAGMRYRILLTETERGKNILLREAEQNIRKGNQMLRENDLELAKAERKELSKQIIFYDEMINKTSDSSLKSKLQQQRDKTIEEWMNSEKK